MKDKCINCNNPFNINNDLISLNYNKKRKMEIQKELLGIKKIINKNIVNNNEKTEEQKEAILKVIDNNIDKKEKNFLNKKIKRNDN